MEGPHHTLELLHIQPNFDAESMKAYNLETALRQPEQITALYIHNRGLREVPVAIQHFRNLRVLVLSANQLTELPSFLRDFPALEHLDISQNQIIAWPEILSHLPSLRQLHLSGNPIARFWQKMPAWPNLEVLHLDEMQLKQYPESIAECPKLRRLSLRANHLRSALPDWSMLPLEHLQLAKNRFRDWPVSGPLPQLQVLDLSQNKLETCIPREGNLLNLEQLLLGNNRISDLPSNFQSLPALRTLDVSKNRLSTLPAIPSLRSLQLANNLIEKVVGDWSNCTTLRELDVSKNRMIDLPPGLAVIPRLRLLNLSGNPLGVLPALSSAPHLMKLELRGHRFTEFPTIIWQMDRLQQLEGLGSQVDCRQLLRFMEQARALEMAPEVRGALYHFWKHDLEQPARATLWQGLKFPQRALRRKCRAALLDTSTLLTKGDYLAGLGRHQFDPLALKTKLQQEGITWQDQIDTQTTHVLLGSGAIPLAAELPDGVQLLSQQLLYRFLHRNSYLLNEPAEVRQNLGRLLTSGQAVSIGLAIEMLKPAGLLDSLRTEAFVAWYSTTVSSQRRALRRMLILSGADETEKALQLANLLRKAVTEERLQQLVDLGNFDLQKLRQFSYFA